MTRNAFFLLACHIIALNANSFSITPIAVESKRSQIQNERIPSSLCRLHLSDDKDDNGPSKRSENDDAASPPLLLEEESVVVDVSKTPVRDDSLPQPPVVGVTATASSVSSRDLMRAMGTSPRRILLSGLSATGIALAGNFLGITSKLLTRVPEDVVEASGLDTYFPRGDFKRCRGVGYTFVIPSEWVADTFVALAKAQRQAKSLDYKISRSSGSTTLPEEAFGPPGRLNKRGVSEQGDTNVSVVVSSGLRGFTLRGTLGSPTNAAETLLRASLAPEGSGRVATLLNAREDAKRGVYQFEYTIDRGTRGVPLRAISVIAERNTDTLLTLTVVAPEEDWNDARFANKLHKIADSFHVFVQ